MTLYQLTALIKKNNVTNNNPYPTPWARHYLTQTVDNIINKCNRCILKFHFLRKLPITEKYTHYNIDKISFNGTQNIYLIQL